MGRADTIGFAAQADMETGATAVSFAPPVTEASPEMNRENLDITETIGNRAPVAQEYGGRVFSNPMQGAFRPRSGGLLLAGFFGEPVSAKPDADEDAVVHTYNPLLRLPIYSSIWTKTDLTHIDQGTILDKYEGCIGNTISFNVEANNYLLYEANYAARIWDPDPTPAPSFTKDTSGKWPFNKVKVEMAVAGVNGGAYSEISAKAFSFAFNNNVALDDFILNSLFVDSLCVGDIELTGTFRPTKDIKGHTRRAMADDPASLKLRMTAVGPEIFAGVNHQFSVELFQLETITAPGNRINAGENLRDVEVSFRAVLNEDVNKLIELKLTNTESGELYQAA